MSNIESQPTHHLNENSAWNWSLKRCACVFSYFHFGFEREHLYLSIPKRRSMFPSSQAITSFYFVQESKCKSPHPLISSFTCCILQSIRTHTYIHSKRFLKFDIDWENIIIAIIAHLCLPHLGVELHWCFGWACTIL